MAEVWDVVARVVSTGADVARDLGEVLGRGNPGDDPWRYGVLALVLVGAGILMRRRRKWRHTVIPG